MTKHISQIKNKTAEVLSNADLIDEFYHNNIVIGAKAMARNGFPNATYHNQYASGTTVWFDCKEYSMTVDVTGRVNPGGQFVADRLHIIDELLMMPDSVPVEELSAKIRSCANQIATVIRNHNRQINEFAEQEKRLYEMMDEIRAGK